MTITRCSERRFHYTGDSSVIGVTDAAAQALLAAKFPKGHSIGCDCGESKGKIKPEDCEGINVRDGEGKLIARFGTKEFSGQQTDDGTILIYRRPGAQTSDSTRPPFPIYAGRPAGNLTLHRLQKIHEDFYRRGDS